MNIYHSVKHLIASRNSTREIVLRDQTGSLIGNSRFFLSYLSYTLVITHGGKVLINVYSNERCFWKVISILFHLTVY